MIGSRYPRVFRAALLIAALGLVSAPAREARADVASWMFVGAGWSRVQDTALGEGSDHSSLMFDAGLGSSPAARWVVGGVFHGEAIFGFGSDWGAALRLVSGGYARGTWGLGLDVGPQYRVGERSGPVGAARLLLGGPWGLGLSAGASIGPDELATFTAVLGVDLARLTVHRTSGLDWFPNPHPSPRREDMERPHQAAAAY